MKQQRSTRTLAALLAALALLPVLGGCARPQPDAPVTAAADPAAAAVSADTAAAPETEAVDPRLQYDPRLAAVDYDGANFTVIYNSGSAVEPNKDFTAEEMTGEVLNDAKFNRHGELSEKYSIDLNYLDGGADAAVVGAIRQAVSAGDDTYSVADLNAQHCIQLGATGNLLEVHTLPVIDLDAPYWNDLMLEGSSINHKNYFLFSDINIHAYGATPCMIFNKVVHKNFGLEDLYDIVTSGRWTFDKAIEMISAVTGDLDGDGRITKDDRLGMIANNFCVDCFISGTGYQLITKDENDLPVLNTETEEIHTIMQNIQKLCSAEVGTFLVDRTSTATEAREYWTEQAITSDRALFWVGNIKCVERMRESESDFGVVPMPKASDAQKDYAIHVQANVGSMLCFPRSAAQNAERIGQVMEDMAYISYRDVMPAYMDKCIDGKAIRDKESLVCLEIIRSSYYCDLGFMCQQMQIDILSLMRAYVTNNVADYASLLKKAQKGLETRIANLGKSFAD